MNFLAHLWLADKLDAALAGAVLGDVVRGRDLSMYDASLQHSIRLHRRIDVLTDAHPRVAAERAAFAPGARRYAGIVLDMLFDHALAQRWTQFSGVSLADFAARSATAVAAAGPAFALAGAAAVDAERFAELLLSYRGIAGIDTALARIARRLRQPQPLLDAAHGWPRRMAGVDAALAPLLADLANPAVARVGHSDEARSHPIP